MAKKIPGFCDSIDAMVDAETVKAAVGAIARIKPRTKAEAIDIIADILDEAFDSGELDSCLPLILQGIDASTLREWLSAMDERTGTKAENIALLTKIYVEIIAYNSNINTSKARGARKATAKPPKAVIEEQAPRAAIAKTPSAMPVAYVTPGEADFLAGTDPIAEGDTFARVQTVQSRQYLHIIPSETGGFWSALRTVQSSFKAPSADGLLRATNTQLRGLRLHGRFATVGAVYLLNPYDVEDTHYIPIDDAQAVLDQIVCTLFPRLAEAVGARRCELSHAHSHETSGAGSVSANAFAPIGGVDTAAARNAQAARRIVNTFPARAGAGSLSPQLHRFVNLHPELQNVVHSSKSGTSVEDEMETRVSSSASGRLQGLQAYFTAVSINASVATARTTKWHFKVDFVLPTE